MKNESALFETTFLSRFSSKRVFFSLSGGVICGILGGSVAAILLEIFQNQAALPLFFSGIPRPETGFLSCFSTILLNSLIGLIILFLLGVTAFGAVGIPIFFACKGTSLAIGILSFLAEEKLEGLVRCALCYVPAATAACLLLLLFAARALLFSKDLVRAGFSAAPENLNFYFYFKDFLYFLCFAVMIAFVGAFLAILCGQIL